MNCIVCKFGGTSIANAEGFYKIVELLKNKPSRRYVVVSAPGKRFKEDEKITDLLYNASYAEVNKKYLEFECLFAQVCLRFFELERKVAFIGIRKKLSLIYQNYLLEKKIDYLVSRGEYLAGELVSALTGFPLLKPERYIRIKSDGTFDEKSELRDILWKVQRAVIPGFYGRDEKDGYIKTFPRGGGDITGAAVALMVQADLYENWTDVDGVYVCDSKFVDEPKMNSFLSYREMYRMSSLGVKVLHKDAIILSKKANIPILICNFFSLKESGTVIGNFDKNSKKYKKGKSKIVGIVECKQSIQEQYNGLSELAVIERDGENVEKVKKHILKILKKRNIPIISTTFSSNEDNIRIEVKSTHLRESVRFIYYEFFT